MARVVRDAGPTGHTYEVVDVFTDHGSRHFQTSPGQPSLFDRLLAYINLWKPLAVICDASGVGQGITDALIKACSHQIIGFDFAKNYGKARLGNNFLALVETGRFKYFRESPGLRRWTPQPACSHPDAWPLCAASTPAN